MLTSTLQDATLAVFLAHWQPHSVCRFQGKLPWVKALANQTVRCASQCTESRAYKPLGGTATNAGPGRGPRKPVRVRSARGTASKPLALAMGYFTHVGTIRRGRLRQCSTGTCLLVLSSSVSSFSELAWFSLSSFCFTLDHRCARGARCLKWKLRQRRAYSPYL